MHRRQYIFFALVLCGVLAGAIASEGAPASPPGGMVGIPAGTFLMGCPPQGAMSSGGDDLPQKSVFLDAFRLDVHEVTVAEYAQCVDAGVCKSARNKKPEGWEDKWIKYDLAYNWGKPERRDHPINGVNWYDASDYCRWKGKRLPTEAEFEKALRGGLDAKIHPWGDGPVPPAGFGNYQDVTAQKRYDFWQIFVGYDDGNIYTAPVCSFKKNPYGLCDISGNVWEWCRDYYDKDWYQDMPSKNPVNKKATRDRVIRGGGWRGTPRSVMASKRIGLPPNEYLSARGFRCAKSQP